MEVRYVFLAAQIIVNAFPQCARSFSVDNADTRQMGEISVIEIFVEFGNRFIHRFSEQIDLGRNRGSLGKLRFPLLVREMDGPVMTASSISTRSEICTLVRMIPIWTKRFPFESGRVLTVPLRFMLKTLTASPR